MKKFYFLLVILFSVNEAIAQWFLQNSGTTHNLHSVYFTDVNTGWAVGDSGTILHTSDGGSNWVIQSSNTTFNLNSVFFTDADHGYAVGNDTLILKTIDGGSTWTNTFYANPGYNYEMLTVHFTDSSTGYIFGFEYSLSASSNMFILKTVDSGANWNLLLSFGDCTEGCEPGSMFFSGPDTGYIIYNEERGATTAKILITTDSWTTSTVHNIAGRRRWAGLSSVFFTDTTGYALGRDSLFKSIDGGITWTNLNGQGNSLFFTNANDGCIVDNGGTILNSNNGGASWATQNSNTTLDLTSVYFIDENTGYAVGDSGVIVKTTNGITGLSEHHQTENVLEVYPNPASANINIETPLKGDLSILNLAGQQLLQERITVQKTTIDISRLPSGVYVIKLIGENGVQMGKIFKK